MLINDTSTPLAVKNNYLEMEMLDGRHQDNRCDFFGMFSSLYRYLQDHSIKSMSSDYRNNSVFPEIYVFIFQVLPNRETLPKEGFSILQMGIFIKIKGATFFIFGIKLGN